MKLFEFAPQYIRAIHPYQPGKPISELVRDLGLEKNSVIKLASNENPLGTSPLALEAMSAALSEIARYPDGSGYELKNALAEHYAVNVDQIVLGNGSNDVLEIAARIFLKPGTAAVYSQHAFAIYPLLAQALGAQGISVPARLYGHDLVAMLNAVTPETRIIFIANPNNPTGTLCDPSDLQRFVERVPQNVLVILDEAYDEYLPEANKANSIAWLRKFPNLLITRTFSKAYGLAGIRVGFALAHPELADLMNRIRQPFNVNSLGLIGALAALKDTEFVRRAFELNRAGMIEVANGLRQLGVEFIPSYGNFITLRIRGDEINTAKAYQNLLRKGVIVRPLGVYEMPHHLRVTIGLKSENEKFLIALAQVIANSA